MNKRSHTHIWLCLNLYCTSLFRNRNLNTKRLDSKHAKIYHRGCIINRSFLFFFFLSPKLETSANRAKSIETFGVLPGVESIKSIALARPPPSGPIPFLPIAGGRGGVTVRHKGRHRSIVSHCPARTFTSGFEIDSCPKSRSQFYRFVHSKESEIRKLCCSVVRSSSLFRFLVITFFFFLEFP